MKPFIAILGLLLLTGCPEPIKPSQTGYTNEVSVNSHDGYDGTWYVNVTARVDARNRTDAIAKVSVVLQASIPAPDPGRTESPAEKPAEKPVDFASPKDTIKP